MCSYSITAGVDHHTQQGNYHTIQPLDNVRGLSPIHASISGGYYEGSDGDQCGTDASDSSTCSSSPSYRSMISQPGAPSGLRHSRTLQQRAQRAHQNGGTTPKKKKAKSTYKHVPHSEKAPHLVAKRNARERRRVMAVNNAFTRLRKHVPCENRNKRISKVKTLKIAIDYIYYLQDLIDEHDHDSLMTQHLRKQMTTLASTTSFPGRPTNSGNMSTHSGNSRVPVSEYPIHLPDNMPHYYGNMHASNAGNAPHDGPEDIDNIYRMQHENSGEYTKDNSCMYNNYVSINHRFSTLFKEKIEINIYIFCNHFYK